MIPTAEEFIANHYGAIWDKRPDKFRDFISREKYIELHSGKIDGVEPCVRDLLIEFATLHGQAMVEAICEQVTHQHKVFDDHMRIDKKSIRNAYPLDNIK